MAQQDPRIALCLNLAAKLTDSVTNTTWQKTNTKIVRPEYAAISVSNGQQNAVCYYEYDAAEESALDDVDELHPYATLPYQMDINGQTVDKQRLAKATQEEQMKTANGLLDAISRLFGLQKT